MFGKIILVIVIILIALGIGGYWFYQSRKPAENTENNGPESAFDSNNATYTIEGNSITLVNGKAEKEIAPGSASKIEVTVWGQPAEGDLNGDQSNDAALILVYSSGGSGTFYYVAAAIKDSQSGTASGTNAILLGDRIAPQNISIDDKKIVVNYSDRKSGEPMSASPSVGITRIFEVQSGTLAEITSESAKKEQACLISGGKIATSLCCQSSGDFPNNCLIGACGCSPSDSHEVKTCDCLEGKCFDGSKCVNSEVVTFCTPEQRNVSSCIQIYDPVCAKVNVQCIKAPCDPVYQTVSNACLACLNSLVESYTKGACEKQ